jgi:hypothetical protein
MSDDDILYEYFVIRGVELDLKKITPQRKERIVNFINKSNARI